MNKFFPKNGFALVISIIVASVSLTIAIVLADFTIKQFFFSGVARDSEYAFHAANAAMECVRYHDIQNDSFDVPDDGSDRVSGVSLSCFDTATTTNGAVASGDEQFGSFSWGTVPTLCSKFSVYKFTHATLDQDMDNIGGDPDLDFGTCPAGFECSVAVVRGYNQSCDNLNSSRVVERSLIIRY